MPEINEEKAVVTAYPPEDLYEEWKESAEMQGMSVSQFVHAMVEIGRQEDIEEEGPVLEQARGRGHVEVSEAAIAVREENPLKFGTKTIPATAEKFSGYYGPPDKEEFERRVGDNNPFGKPKIGDLEAMRFYLGLKPRAVTDKVGVSRGTYYHWRKDRQDIGFKSRAKAVTFLTDAWNDATFRSEIVDPDQTTSTGEGNYRVALLRHLCDLASVPKSVRSEGVVLNKFELEYVYGALSGDYRTPVHASNQDQILNLIARECDMPDGVGSGRLTVETLLTVQERLMETSKVTPVINSIDRLESFKPRPHVE